MGLSATGNYGAKAQLKQKCDRAFQTYDSLLQTRQKIESARRQAASIIDMNVIMMSVPSSVTTLHEFKQKIWRYVEDAIGTTKLTVLVYDEPCNMTNAKKLEQARRDASKKKKEIQCSDDIDPFPFTDNYSAYDLQKHTNILAVRDKRSCRSRLYDEIAKFLMGVITEKIQVWNATGNSEHETIVVFDGVDIRGCDRPAFASRNVEIVATDPEVAGLFQRETPIGEGDLKLQDIEDKIRMHSIPGEPLHGINLVMLSTIDTDSLMISSLAVSKRRVAPFGSNSLMSVLCMRNRAQMSSGDNGMIPSNYLVVDTKMLEACILEHVYGVNTTVEPEEALNTMIAVAAGAALSGCDFCSLQGARFDHFFNCIQDFARTEPLALNGFKHCLSEDPNETKKACYGLRRLCYNASVKMEDLGKRYSRQALSVGSVDDQTLRRAIWTACYWSKREHVANESFGFVTFRQTSSCNAIDIPCSDDDDGRKRARLVTEPTYQAQ